jgi:hypothetical protein
MLPIGCWDEPPCVVEPVTERKHPTLLGCKRISRGSTVKRSGVFMTAKRP